MNSINLKNLRSAILSFALLVGMLTSPTRASAEIKTVSFVDVSKYLGDWYQIGHIPMFYEGGACSCTRQRLTTTPTAGVIGVYNSCNDKSASGPLRTITGTASNDDTNTNSKFTVKFQGVPVKGSYWIIGLDSLYRYAVVSDSRGSSLYILSKTPTLSENLYQEAVGIGAQQVDISKLEKTDQANCIYPK